MPVSQQHSPTLRDCVYGQAVGDALGVPYEFRARGTFECTGMVGHGSHNQPAGTWSDDTSMALATCDSIRATGRIDVRDMRERFVRWYREGAYTVSGLFDIGGTTADALSSGRGRAGERDNGNGSLMRILLLAFTGATGDEVRAVSAITHAHAISCEACVRVVHVARRLVAGEGPRDVAGSLVGVPASQIRSSGFVLDTERAALWCLANTSSYAECVLTAVNLGDDTDTTPRWREGSPASYTAWAASRPSGSTRFSARRPSTRACSRVRGSRWQRRALLPKSPGDQSGA
jgi:ADP-ribosylglycohydrolase